MIPEIYKNRQTQEVIKYIRDAYGDELEFLWQKFPSNAIWRNKKNRKWYGALLIVAGDKLGLSSSGEMEILDLKFDKGAALDFAAETPGIYPGYHMNKNSWITIILDGSVKNEQLFTLIDHSYQLSAKATKNKDR